MTQASASKNSGRPLFEAYGDAILALFCAAGLLFAANAIAGVAFSDTLYPASGLYDSFLPNDWINILLGFPVVVLSAVLALRGRRLGAIGIGASLLFILYNAVAYLYALKNAFSLIVNALTVLLCAAGLILLMTSMRRRQPAPEPFPVRRPKLYGAILIVMGLIFIGRAAGNFVGAATGSANLPAPETRREHRGQRRLPVLDRQRRAAIRQESERILRRFDFLSARFPAVPGADSPHGSAARVLGNRTGFDGPARHRRDEPDVFRPLRVADTRIPVRRQGAVSFRQNILKQERRKSSPVLISAILSPDWLGREYTNANMNRPVNAVCIHMESSAF